MRRWRGYRNLGLAALAGLLTACTPLTAPNGSGPGVYVPPTLPPKPQSESSLALARYYGGLQADLLRQGLLRTDGGGVDTPYNARQLAQNFETIAFYDEYQAGSWDRLEQPEPSRLRRWSQPIKVAVEFGASVPAEQQRLDATNIRLFAQRLNRVSGHSVAMAEGNVNFHVLVMGEDDRGQLLQRMRTIVPRLDPGSFRVVETMPRSTHCLMLNYSASHNSYDIRRALVVIRAEHPDILRKSCVHEEMAQALGLINDSFEARPSIFNDNDEFAFLTRHDEQLLQMLYDPRLQVGMGLEAARPVVRQIAAELLGGNS